MIKHFVSKLWLYVRNLFLLLNYLVVTVIGKDPRMTISAILYIYNLRWPQLIVNALYRDPNHCATAATGWVNLETREKTEWAKKYERSLW